MTRDQEIRRDLERQWQKPETSQTDAIVTQEIVDFLKIANGFAKKKQPLKLGQFSQSPAKH